MQNSLESAYHTRSHFLRKLEHTLQLLVSRMIQPNSTIVHSGVEFAFLQHGIAVRLQFEDCAFELTNETFQFAELTQILV